MRVSILFDTEDYITPPEVGLDDLVKMLADEVGGILEMGEILGAPVSSFARHGGSYSPQLVTALGRLSRPYCHSPVRLPNHNIKVSLLLFRRSHKKVYF